MQDIGDFPGGPLVGSPPANTGIKSLIPGTGRSHMPRSSWTHNHRAHVPKAHALQQ